MKTARINTKARWDTDKFIRRILALVLMALLGLPLAIPVLISALLQPDNSNLPACCRGTGKHRCMMRAALPGGSESPASSRLQEKCPYFPHATITAHDQAGASVSASYLFSGMLADTSGPAQAQAGYRISFHRSRQKRGPPSSLAV